MMCVVDCVWRWPNDFECGPTVQCTMYVVLQNSVQCMWSLSKEYNVCVLTVQCTMYVVLQYSNVCGPTVQCTMSVVLQYSVQCMWSYSTVYNVCGP